MPQTAKPTPKKTADTAKKGAEAAKQGAEKASKAASDVFEKMKKHFDPKKVDAWQKKWLAVPENRKKYEKVADAPEVVGEELTAMVNDIIDFAQGEEGGKSHVFSKIKSGVGSFFKKAKSVVPKKGVPEKKSAAKPGKGAKK